MNNENRETSEPTADFAGLRCPKCDYELTGLSKSQCPECGERFEPTRLNQRADWDKELYRRSAWVLLAIVSVLLVMQLLGLVAARWDVAALQLFHQVLIALGFIPLFVHGATGLAGFLLSLLAASSQAYTSALIAFVACIVGGVGVLMQYAALVNFH